MTQILFQNITGKPVGEPIKLDRRIRRLSTIAKKHAPNGRPFIVSRHGTEDPWIPCDQTVLMRKRWKDTLVRGDDIIIITTLPLGGSKSGGGGSFKQIGMAVAAIALVAVGQIWAAPALAGALGISAGAATAIVSGATAGIIAGAQYLMARAQQSKDKKKADERLYGVSGGGNVARAGERIPRRYGRTWATDVDLTQPDFIVNEGEDQILYKRMTLTLGYATVHEIQVGKATLWQNPGGIQAPFEGAQVEIIQPGGVSTLVPAIVTSNANISGIQLPRTSDTPAFSGPWEMEIPPEGGKFQLDYSVPQVYFNYSKTGSPRAGQVPFSWEIQFEIARADADGNPVTDYSIMYHRLESMVMSTKAQRFTQFVEGWAPGKYLIRARNLSYKDDQGVNDIIWDGLRVWSNEKIIRPHVTEIALKVRSGKALGITAFADVAVDCTAKVPVWNGSAWVLQESRKAIDAFTDILRGKVGNIVYGANLSDAEIDTARVHYYRNFLTEHDEFNGVIRGPVSVFEACSTVLGVIRAEPARIGNAWSFTRDEPRQVTARHVFSRRQVVKGSTSTSFQISITDGSADVIGEYNPKGDPRKRREVRQTFGVRTETPRRIDLTGITDHKHATAFCKWVAASAYYRRRKRSVTTELSGRLIKRNDPAIIDAYFMSPESKAAGILSSNGFELTLDSDAPVIDASTYVLFRDRTNKAWGPVNATRHPTLANVITLDANDVIATEAFTQVPFDQVLTNDYQDMTTVLIGSVDVVENPYIIQSVEPQSRDRISVSAIEDSPVVWQLLSEPIPDPPPGIDIGDLNYPVLPNIPWIKAFPIQRNTGLYMEWSIGESRNVAQYVIEISNDDWVTKERVSSDLDTEGVYPLKLIEETETHEVKVRAYAINKSGVRGLSRETSFWTFKPVLDSGIAKVIAEISELQDQVKRDIKEISEIGQNSLRDVLKRANDALEQLASDAATEAGNAYEARQFNKVAVGEAFAAIKREEQLRISDTDALAEVSLALSVAMRYNGVTLKSDYLEDIKTAIDLTGTGPTAASSKITALQTTINGANGVLGLAAITQDLKTSVGLTGTGVNAKATLIENLSVQVNGVGGILSRVGSVESRAGTLEFREGVAFTVNGNAVGGYEMTARQRLDGTFLSQFGISGNLVVTGTITGTKLQANSAIITGQLQVGDLVIGTDSIRNFATTQSNGATGPLSASVTINIRRTTSRAMIFATYNGRGQTAQGADIGTMTINRNGSPLLSISNNFSPEQGLWYVGQTTILFYDSNPPVGNVTYNVTDSNSGGVTLFATEMTT